MSGAKFSIQLEWDALTSQWVVQVPELGGISTFGVSVERALRNAVDLIEGHVGASLEHGFDVGVPEAQAREIFVGLRG